MEPTQKTRTARLAAPLIALGLMAGVGSLQAQYYGPPPPPRPPSYGPVQSWEQAPPEFQEAMQRGFRDGVEGARKDFDNHRPPDVNNRDEYRNPKFIQRPDRRDYRIGFQRGYDVAVRHIYGGGRGYGPR